MPLHLPCCQRAWHVIMRMGRWVTCLPVWTKYNLTTEGAYYWFWAEKGEGWLTLERNPLTWQVTANQPTTGSHGVWGWASLEAISLPPLPGEAVPTFEINSWIQCLPCARPSSTCFPYIYSLNGHNNTLHSHLAGEESEVRFLPPSGSTCSDGLCLR